MRGTSIDDPSARRVLDAVESAAAADGEEHERQAAALLRRPEDVVAALEYLAETDREAALRMAAALTAFWQDAGRVDDGRRLTDLVLDQAEAPVTSSVVECLLAASELAFRQGDQATAERRSRQAIEHAQAIGEPALAAIGHVDLARIAYRDADAERIDHHARRALDLAGDDPRARRGALHMLAWAAHTAGDRLAARRRFEDSLAFRRTLGDRLPIAAEIANLGDLATEEGDMDEAARRFGEALEIGAEIDSQYLILNLLPSIAVLAALVGDDDSAVRLIGATEALASSSGLIPDPGNGQPALDAASHRLGRRSARIRAEGAALGREASVDLARGVINRSVVGTP